MNGGFGSRLGSAGLMADVVVVLMAGSSGVVYASGEAGCLTSCLG